MDKMLVTVFNDESKAYGGTRALKELHAEGSVTLFASAVIAKDARGEVSIKQAADQGPVQTALGLATGSLIGLLGGPVGLAIGAAAGTLTGSLFDIAHAGVNYDFVNEVSRYLLPGKTAVVAEIDEEWVTPLNTRMDALGGVVFRRARGEYIDAQIERETAAEQAELARLKAERDQAVGEVKAKLQASIDTAQERLQARRNLINETITAIKTEGEAKVKSLQEQAATAKGEMKATVDARLAEARADHNARVAKLNQLWQQIKDPAAA